MVSNAQNYHIQYPGITNQHWHAGSGKYAGGDHLMTALHDGWTLSECYSVNRTYAGMRFISVYEFHLKRDDEMMTMPVINNPYIERFIQAEDIKVLSKDDHRDEEVA
jgi:hypothetical protein